MSQSIAEDKFLPCAAKLDANEPTFDGEKAHLIPEVREALDAYTEAGMFGASFEAELGGAQMPDTVALFAKGIFNTANLGITNYSFLTQGAANLIKVFGTQEQKDTFLPPMIAGDWYGTMCLSEPQAGFLCQTLKPKQNRLLMVTI